MKCRCCHAVRYKNGRAIQQLDVCPCVSCFEYSEKFRSILQNVHRKVNISGGIGIDVLNELTKLC